MQPTSLQIVPTYAFPLVYTDGGHIGACRSSSWLQLLWGTQGTQSALMEAHVPVLAVDGILTRLLHVLPQGPGMSKVLRVLRVLWVCQEEVVLCG